MLVFPLLPRGEITIRGYAFAGCSSMNSVLIPEGVEKLGGGEFWICSSIVHIRLPTSLHRIGRVPFDNCHSHFINRSSKQSPLNCRESIMMARYE